MPNAIRLIIYYVFWFPVIWSLHLKEESWHFNHSCPLPVEVWLKPFLVITLHSSDAIHYYLYTIITTILFSAFESA